MLRKPSMLGETGGYGMAGTELEALLRRVEALEAERDIKALKYRYLRACDRKDPAGVRDCLDPRGVVIAYEGFPRFEDRDAFVAVFERMACKPTIFDMHHGENPEIVLTGPDAAEGVWELFFQSIDSVAGTLLQMNCRYTDVYARHDGRWWISRTATVRTSFLMQKRGEDGAMAVLAMGKAPEGEYGTAE